MRSVGVYGDILFLLIVCLPHLFSVKIGSCCLLAIGDEEGRRKGGLSGGKEGALRIEDRERLEFIFFFCLAEEIKVGKWLKTGGEGRRKEGNDPARGPLSEQGSWT
jgi:hypothetical protein